MAETTSVIIRLDSDDFFTINQTLTILNVLLHSLTLGKLKYMT